MSYTALASRGENFNLNIFSHPPVKPAPEQQYTQAFYQKTHTPAAFSDDEDIFDLDMVTMDMDFEQAYSMYLQLQQKNALLEVEQLQRAQQNYGNPYGNGNVQLSGNIGHLPGNHNFSGLQNLNQTLRQSHPSGNQSHQFNGSLAATPLNASQYVHAHGLNPALTNPALLQPHGTQGAYRNISISSAAAPVHPQPRRLHRLEPEVQFQYDAFTKDKNLDELQLGAETDHDDSVEDADQFFSNTESDALLKFLDNLASSQVNPLDFYKGAKHELKKPTPAQNGEVKGKHELDEFKHVPFAEKRSVITPPDSAAEDEPRKRRKSGKPLLSLEQKRLNHLHLEQKRRLLCKEAYERCLRLITNVDDYKNELVSARSVASSKKKSKRRQLNKAGLPNLSKHSALTKISAEIEKIQKKNDMLRQLAGCT